MTPEQHIKLILAHEEQVRNSKDDLRMSRELFAKEHGKYQPGDVVDIPRASGTGGFAGRKCRILSALGHVSAFSEATYLIRYHGQVLKKDGSDTSYYVDWPEYSR